ncbi:type II toxin-antitoxin system HicB family antitoxin [Salaquimonas pukyongi]|uniref:type II toxin-antitoxin system HicB family antitoxin n=1 Tax=Salaquimonas pukyongi TaxID=2712698 RepID=UPI00096B9E3D|nr:type II toxin-antitoxin system HicB family antitoxin [Salaquimonas pukyongi]
MTHYIAIVHKDENSAWGVSFPDLPGCFSAADSEADILPNAMEALEFFAEDLARMPSPSSIEAIRGLPDIASDLKTGAYLISVPLLKNIGKSARINITLDKGLLEAIDDAAQQRKMTRSGFLAQAAAKEIGG